MFTKTPSKGFSIVEILISASIIVMIGLAGTASWQTYLKLNQRNSALIQSALLTEEAAEALNLLRDQGWSTKILSLPLSTPFYLSWTGSAYATSSSAVALGNNYAVSVTLSSVMRDSNSNIVSSGGTTDPNTLLATITVASMTSTSTPISSSQILIHNVYSN